MTGYTLERVIKVYDDSTGGHFYVGPDADGLDCVEVRSVDERGKIETRIFLGPPALALLIAQAILELYAPKETAP